MEYGKIRMLVNNLNKLISIIINNQVIKCTAMIVRFF